MPESFFDISRRPMTTPLSAAAQAVKSAAEEVFWDPASDQPQDPGLIAAALIRYFVILHGVTTKGGGTILSGNKLLDIAAELEGHHG
jgi:hypothetical protein